MVYPAWLKLTVMGALTLEEIIEKNGTRANVQAVRKNIFVY